MTDGVERSLGRIEATLNSIKEDTSSLQERVATLEVNQYKAIGGLTLLTSFLALFGKSIVDFFRGI